MGILEEILEHKRTEIAGKKHLPQGTPLSPRGFRNALAKHDGVALIAEVKKASPSKGVIVEDFDAVRIAAAYQEGGATCLSVLTDEQFFQGSLDDLRKVRDEVGLPILRKDFIIDELQIIESSNVGADCILLIVAALDKYQLTDYLKCAKQLMLDVLVEVHDEKEMDVAGNIGADLIGINNRDLKTFETDLQTTARLARYAPKDALLVSESAIWEREDVLFAGECGAKAVLVGESLERQKDIVQAVRELMWFPSPAEG